MKLITTKSISVDISKFNKKNSLFKAKNNAFKAAIKNLTLYFFKNCIT